ncbi:MAG: methyltransferase [Deltaproteobacteria bacterium]|nr:methyltransferase [Deltaproteobacteria bacterium]
MGLRNRVLQGVKPSPVAARHAEYSMLYSADDEPARPSERLLDVALAAVSAARKADLLDLARRVSGPIAWTEVWPGEHYKLLAGLVQTLQPKVVVEIGTATGLSALVLRKFLPRGGKVVTFDVVPWRQYPGAVLREEDFADGSLQQLIDDLQSAAVVQKHHEVLSAADFIFIDAAKDGVMEQRFLDNLLRVRFVQPPLVMFDDIRVWNMLRIWRGVRMPKLDLTSFGHWSGTGLIDWVA